MKGHTLVLSQDTTITLHFDAESGEYVPFFTNVGALEIAGLGRIESGTDLSDVLHLAYAGEVLPEDSFQIIYTDDGSLALQIPEPATATLSLLALAGLAARRRRR